MNVLPSVDRFIFLCPDLDEVGGIGAVSRMALSALQSEGKKGEMWSFGAPQAQFNGAHTDGWVHRYACGSRGRYVSWGLGTALQNAEATLVVSMHLQLAPVVLPLTKRGARLAVFLHGSESWVPLTRLRAAAISRANVLIANSRFTVRQFRAANPRFTDAEITICPLGVPQIEASAVGDGGQSWFALLVGRISAKERHKGHDSLLELWPQVIKRFPSARLLIVGDGDDRCRLEQRARALGLMNAVSFLGQVSQETLEQLYATCAFVVMPSGRLEGFGLVFLEAMRAGKACIGGEGAAEEVIENGLTGKIVPDGRPQVLLEALTAFFGDPSLCARMGRAGRERFLRHFTESHFRARFLIALGLEQTGGAITVERDTELKAHL